MHSFNDSQVLPYTKSQLYNIILDIEQYPCFLPWCKEASIIEKKDAENFHAELQIGYKSINEAYLSEIYAVKDKSIITNAVKGPFKYMENRWTFVAKDSNSCLVDFSIKFQFKSFILDKLMGTVLHKASTKLVKAFEDRAFQLHGNI